MSDEQPDEGIPGMGVFLASYTAEDGADTAFEGLKDAELGGFAYENAAVVRRDAAGEVHIDETGDMTSGRGAGVGALVGGLIGILGGPAGMALGAGAGAAIGGVAAHNDAGFNDESLERIGGALPAGTSALAVTTTQDFVAAVQQGSTDEETLTLAQNIADEISGSLGAGKDMLMALVLTEGGISATKVVSGPDSLAVFGILAS
ncbi:MAG: DUF1269 domain-containing protein [Acidimicrobiales bacterium]